MSQERAFRDEDARAAWNRGARAWDEFVESGADYYRHDIHGPALLAACEPLANLRVLDLGCGQGYFCRQLAGRGAHVVGIDIAEQQIAYAQQHEARHPLGIEYHVVSATAVDRCWQPGSFDLVTACMSLHDMADPGAALRGAFQVLRPGGRMAFSLPHPCTDTPYREWERGEEGEGKALKIDRYFDSGPTIVRWTMKRLIYHWHTPYWRRTLSEWSELVAEADFLIRRLYEPRPTEEQIARNPHIEDAYRLPGFLIFVVVKPDGGA